MHVPTVQTAGPPDRPDRQTVPTVPTASAPKAAGYGWYPPEGSFATAR